MGNGKWWTALALAGALVPAGTVSAQDYSEPAGYIGLSFIAGNPLGEFDGFFDQGFEIGRAHV